MPLSALTNRKGATRIGVISDTHGLLRPQALAALEGSDLILHAGDIGSVEVLEALGKLAETIAVRGNNDQGGWAAGIPETQEVEVGGARIYMIHSVKDLKIDAVEAGFQVVVSGHSHKPSIEKRNGVLYLNPGSAGPRRFKLPISVARLEVSAEHVDAALIQL